MLIWRNLLNFQLLCVIYQFLTVWDKDLVFSSPNSHHTCVPFPWTHLSTQLYCHFVWVSIQCSHYYEEYSKVCHVVDHNSPFFPWVFFCLYHCDHHPSVINDIYSHCLHAPVWKPLNTSWLIIWGIPDITFYLKKLLVGAFDQLELELVVICARAQLSFWDLYLYHLVESCQPCILCLPLSWFLPSYSWAWELPLSTFYTSLILDFFLFFQYNDL